MRSRALMIVMAVSTFPIAIPTQANSGDEQSAPATNGPASFNFIPNPDLIISGIIQYYDVRQTTDRICQDRSEAVKFETYKVFGHVLHSDNYATGESRSITANGGPAYIRAWTQTPYGTGFGSYVGCQNTVQFTPIPGHTYEAVQHVTLSKGSLTSCNLTIVDKQTAAQPADLLSVRLCK